MFLLRFDVDKEIESLEKKEEEEKKKKQEKMKVLNKNTTPSNLDLKGRLVAVKDRLMQYYPKVMQTN